MYRLNSLNADIQLTVDGDRQVISLSRLANNSGFLCIFVEDKLHLGNAIVQAHCYCSRFALYASYIRNNLNKLITKLQLFCQKKYIYLKNKYVFVQERNR